MNSRSFISIIIWSLLSGLFFTGVAQDHPPVKTTPSIVAVETVPEAANAPETGVSGTPKKEGGEKWEQELLRDPFWPVGFFPEGWQTKKTDQSDLDMDGSGWKAASGRVRISGTSRLGDRTVAIINGELKGIGDPVEVMYEGKTYQWQIVGIDADGQIQLKKQGIR